MNTVFKKVAHHLTIVTCALLVIGCNKALIYSEGTNVSLATLKVNDDVTEPVSVNFGLERTIAVVAPPKTKDGDSINMVSGFMLDDDGSPFGTMTIKTQFASGEAGLNLATNSPQAAAQIMNVTSVKPDGPQLRARKTNAINFVRTSADTARLDTVAERMGVKNNRPNNPQLAITDALINADNNLFNTYASIIKTELGSPF